MLSFILGQAWRPYILPIRLVDVKSSRLACIDRLGLAALKYIVTTLFWSMVLTEPLVSLVQSGSFLFLLMVVSKAVSGRPEN